MNMGELLPLGDRLTAYEKAAQELEADKARVVTAKEGLKVSADALALLQAELTARAEVIARREAELAQEASNLANELEDIDQELKELREQFADDRKAEDETLNGYQEELDRLRGNPAGGAQETGDPGDGDDGEESEGQARQGTDNG